MRPSPAAPVVAKRLPKAGCGGADCASAVRFAGQKIPLVLLHCARALTLKYQRALALKTSVGSLLAT